MKTFKYQINGQKEIKPENSLLNKKKSNNTKKQKIRELEEKEIKQEIKETLNN